MKLSDIKRDPVAYEQGAWVNKIPGMGSLRLKVRGADNADWRRIRLKMIGDIPEHERIEGIDPALNDTIVSTCLLEAGLIDWDGIDDDAGKPIPYSKEQAKVLLFGQEWAEFRDAALWAAMRVGRRGADQLGSDVKN